MSLGTRVSISYTGKYCLYFISCYLTLLISLMFTAAEMKTSLEDAEFTARETALSFALRQWDLLHGEDRISQDTALNSFIDPEALFLISLGLQHIERRFSKELNWFVQHGVHLINFRRIKQLARLFPPGVAARLGTYSHLEWQQQSGHYPKKGSLFSKANSNNNGHAPVLTINQALLMKLRAGFGTSAETDILACLIGINQETTAERIADLLGYPTEPIFRKLNSMVLSRFIKMNTQGEATTFRANHSFVSSLLKQNDNGLSIPIWISWMHIYSFLAHIINFIQEEKITNVKPYALSKEAGKIMKKNTAVFKIHGFDVEEPTLGTDYFATFNQSIRLITSWVNSDPITLQV